MREFLSFKAVEDEAFRKHRMKYLCAIAEKNFKVKNLNAWFKSVQAALGFFILVMAFIFMYYIPFEFGRSLVIATLLALIIFYAVVSHLTIKKVIATHHGYQSLSLLYDKIVIKEIQRWVKNNDISSERLLNVYLPHVQKLLEEHTKTSLIERLKSQWGKIFLLPSALFVVFSFIFQLPGTENASSGEILYANILVLIIGVIILVFTGLVTLAILSFYAPDL